MGAAHAKGSRASRVTIQGDIVVPKRSAKSKVQTLEPIVQTS